MGIAVVASMACAAGCADIRWEYEYKRAKRKSTDLNRPMFIYFRDWMNPHSPQVENSVLRQPESESLLRETVNVFLDIRLYQDVATLYSISEAPAYVIAKPDGEAVDRYVGIPTLEDFLGRVSRAIQVAKPTTQPAAASTPGSVPPG
jgi:hypothetical protein